MDVERVILSGVMWADVILTAALPWLILAAWIGIAAFTLAMIHLIGCAARRAKKKRKRRGKGRHRR